jgi:hypothetical protein
MLICLYTKTAFVLWRQSGAVITETLWSTKPQQFNGLFTGDGQLYIRRQSSSYTRLFDQERKSPSSSSGKEQSVAYLVGGGGGVVKGV